MGKRILTIDGGGIRGLIPLYVLYVIEKKTQTAIYKQFDIIAGTSTGAIIAGLLAIGTPTEKILDFYLGEQAKMIFKKGWINPPLKCPKYDHKNIEQVLQEAFGEASFKDCLTDLLIPADDWSNRKGRIFSSFEERTKDDKLWNAVRASSAAETYFKAHNGMFDGGLYANNPTDLAIVESIKYLGVKSLSDLFIISLGTGTMVDSKDPQQIDKMGLIDIITNILPEVMDRIVSKTDDLLSKIMPAGTYFRLQFGCPQQAEAMDDCSDQNLSRLKSIANSHIQTIWREDLKTIIKHLQN